MLPPATTWEQFPIIAVILLVVGISAMGLRAFWRELATWMDAQDKKREEEREKQRSWEAEQNRLREAAADQRDKTWQRIIATMQAEQIQRTQETNALLADLVNQVKCVGLDLQAHDNWVRESSPPRAKRG